MAFLLWEKCFFSDVDISADNSFLIGSVYEVFLVRKNFLQVYEFTNIPSKRYDIGNESIVYIEGAFKG